MTDCPALTRSTSAPRTGALTLAVATALALAGCAAPSQYAADVSSFGAWPTGRGASSFAFERLPSQAAQADRQQQLEDAARPALARAGFRPVGAQDKPDVVVQLGARVGRTDRSPWDDPLWWRGSAGLWRGSPWLGHRGGFAGRGIGPYPYAYTYTDTRRYEREVALLIRDRDSGAPLYEAHASSEGAQSSLSGQLAPLFAAALQEFPASVAAPHAVTVQLAP